MARKFSKKSIRLSKETQKNIKQSEKEIREGKTIPLSKLKKKLGF